MSDIQGDLAAMAQYKSNIIGSARNNNLEPSLVAGIISRESNGGRTLKNGYGFDGHGYGLMQVDDRYHTSRGSPCSAENIAQGCEILRYMMNQVSKEHPGWTPEQKRQGGIAAYNCGPKNVTNPNNVDAKTYQGNYSRDVLQRAAFFRQNGY